MASPFNGRWAIDMEESREWDITEQRWVPDHVGREVATIHIDGDKYHFELEIGLNPVAHIEFDVVLDGDWAPYLCTRLDYPEDGQSPEFDPHTQGLQHVAFEVGKPISDVRYVKVSETTHARVSRHPQSKELLYTMTEEITPDGRLRAFVTSPDGVPMIYRIADKIG